MAKRGPLEKIGEILCQLRLAKERNDAHLFSALVQDLLTEGGAYPPPAGVFQQLPKPRGMPGRPRGGAAKRRQIFEMWKECSAEKRSNIFADLFSGKVSIDSLADCCSIAELAEAVYGSEFVKDPKSALKQKRRKNQIQTCRNAVDRELEALLREIDEKYIKPGHSFRDFLK